MDESHSQPPAVLVLDQDPQLLKGMEYVFQKLGMVAYVTSDREEFLIEAWTGEYALMVIEHLGLSSGVPAPWSALDLVSEIRERMGSEPKILVIADKSDSKVILSAIQCGANDFAVKPLDREHLSTKIARYFNTREMEEMGVGRVVYPQRTMPGTLTSALQLRAVSEWGVSIWGAHQLLQGTWVNFKSEQLQHILGERSPRNAGLQMKVVSVSKDPEPLQDGRQFYCATLEFDRVKLPQAARRSLRRWLKENVPS